ncbi:MAG: TraK family protein [Methylococcales bacterium]|nr:TraK family protein [Methylococcales bacterium]
MSKKTLRLTERIAVRASTKKPTEGAKNRAAFLALRDEIKESLSDRWSIKIIWETLYEEKKISFSYQAFRKYVNQLIRLPDSRQPPTPKPLEEITETESQTNQAEPLKQQDTKRTGFAFSPVPDKDKLV